MADDLWDCEELVAEEADDEEWPEGSDSDSSSKRARKRRKRGRPVVRQVETSSDDGEQQQQELVDDEDDPFPADVFTGVINQQAAKRQKRDDTPSPVVLDSEGVTEADTPARSNGTWAARGSGAVDAARISSKAQQLAERQRVMREQLEQVRRFGEEEEDIDDEPEIVPLSPLMDSSKRQKSSDEQADPLDWLAADITPAATSKAEAQGAAAEPADDKLPLKFKTQDQREVTVRVNPSEPLQAALDKFRDLVQQQGWGRVTKFMSPDGDKLTGNETAEELQLEQDDIIEVYLG